LNNRTAVLNTIEKKIDKTDNKWLQTKNDFDWMSFSKKNVDGKEELVIEKI